MQIDLELTGDFTNRLIGVDDDGRIVTEPVAIERGEVIAEGLDDALGSTPVDHPSNIVRMARRHFGQQQCGHPGDVFFCAVCGARVDES